MVKLGVLGVGTISRCVLEGICSAFLNNEFVDELDKVLYISQRNSANSNELKEKYPDFIEISSNEYISENCDWIIASVRPEQVETLTKNLSFKEDQIILNFISVCLTEEQAREYFNPVKTIVRISPWPCSKNRLGPVLVLNTEGGDKIDNLLNLFGNVVKVNSIDQFISMQSSSCFMAPFYQALDSITKWLEKENIEKDKASLFVGSLVHAFAYDAKKQGGNGYELITKESQTPGGMNEQALKSLQNDGAFEALQNALTGLVNRVKNK